MRAFLIYILISLNTFIHAQDSSSIELFTEGRFISGRFTGNQLDDNEMNQWSYSIGTSYYKTLKKNWSLILQGGYSNYQLYYDDSSLQFGDQFNPATGMIDPIPSSYLINKSSIHAIGIQFGVNRHIGAGFHIRFTTGPQIPITTSGSILIVEAGETRTSVDPSAILDAKVLWNNALGVDKKLSNAPCGLVAGVFIDYSLNSFVGDLLPARRGTNAIGIKLGYIL